MTDRRLTPNPALIESADPARICMPVVDLLRDPEGPRDRQLLYGDSVSILHRNTDCCLVRATKDGYCGWVPEKALAPCTVPTHQVTARATHAYRHADFKSANQYMLSFGSHLTAQSQTASFIETELGHVPRQHLRPIDAQATDPAAIAELFLGTPYLWGGNSCLGIDCSGLVQAALHACGFPCPGDSDQQENSLGETLEENAPLKRNDLIFWHGHVALVTDQNTLIHANAGHMAVVFEPVTAALERIEVQGDGRPTSRKRLPFFGL